MINRTKLALSFCGLTALGAIALADDNVMTRMGFQQGAAETSVVKAITEDNILYGPAWEAFVKTSEKARAALIQSALVWIKAYTEGDAFKAEYARLRGEEKPTTTADISKSAATPEMAQVAAMMNDPKFQAMMKQNGADYQAEDQKKMQAFNDSFPEDSRILIAKRLREFVDLSDDVDFGAKLEKHDDDGKMYFVDPKCEAKSGEWKMCFRAGKDVVKTARKFAMNWLAEIEKAVPAAKRK